MSIEDVAQQLNAALDRVPDAELIEASAAIDEAIEHVAALASESNSAELGETFQAWQEASARIVELRSGLDQAAQLVESYMASIGAVRASGGGSATPDRPSPTGPAGDGPPPTVRARDGSEYPADAAWAAGDLPPRVRENQGDRTTGYVDGSLIEKFTSGNDGTWTPYVRERGRALGLPERIMERLSSHVELKAAARMIQRGQQHSELVINHVPCGSQPHQRPGCHQAVERFLPKGHSLTVHGTTQQGTPYSHTYKGQA